MDNLFDVPSKIKNFIKEVRYYTKVLYLINPFRLTRLFLYLNYIFIFRLYLHLTQYWKLDKTIRYYTKKYFLTVIDPSDINYKFYKMRHLLY